MIGASRPITAKEDKGRTGSLERAKKGARAEEVIDAKEARSLSKAEEAGKVYDQSLLRAINQVILWRPARIVHPLLRPLSRINHLASSHARVRPCADPPSLLTLLFPNFFLTGSGPPDYSASSGTLSVPSPRW